MIRKLTIGIVMASMLAACASQKPKEEPKPQTQTQAPAAEQAAQPAEATAPAQAAADPLNDPNSILAKRSVYYPFDVSVVQSADRPIVDAHAQYLSTHSGTKVRLEGNCDERGSNEYNLALGQRRADGVKKLLIAGGAKAGQIEAVSNGEEKPKMSCHAEKCWKENRRTDLQYGK